MFIYLCNQGILTSPPMAADTKPPSDTDQSDKRSPSKESHRPQRTPKVADYLRVFSYATKWDFFIYALASVASIGAGITMPLMNIILGQLVDQFTDYFKDMSNISSDDFQAILDKQALYIMALFLARWGLNTINKYCFRMIGIRLSSAIRLHYLQSLFSQSIHVIDSMPAGAPATAITATSNILQVGISERLGTFLEFNGTIWAAIIVAFVWSWDITLVTSSLILYMVVVLSISMPILVKGQTATGSADAQGTAIASESLQGIRLVTACGAQSRVIARYKQWVERAMKEGQKMASFMGLHLGLIVRLVSPPSPDNANRSRVLRCLWHFRPYILVPHATIHRRRHRQPWSYHHRPHVRHADPHVLGTHRYPADGCEQSHGCCM
jgi:hypothetical protein